MAQLERTIQGSTEGPETLKAHASAPTIEHIMKVNEDRSTSPTSSLINADQEDSVYSPNSKKSVLTKVKERAKKLKNSLSGRKRYDPNDPNNNSWDTNSHDNDDEYEHDEAEVDPEYLGAPMYESEAAPEILKETARQHPRADPVVSENHMCPKMNTTESMSEKCDSPNKTITESVSEKLAPAYAAVSGATHNIASKFTGLAVTTSPQNLDNYGKNKKSPTGLREHNPHQKWDRGASGKDEEALLARAITEAMSPRKSDNVSNSEGGVVEKVKEAVTSIFRHDDPVDSRGKSVNSSSGNNTVSWSSSGSSLQNRDAYRSSAVYGAGGNISRHVPASTNAHEVVEEENHGRRLQLN